MKTNTIRLTVAFAAVLALTAGEIRADNESDDQHPLDKEYEAEQAKPQPEHVIIRRFAVKWDAELNRLYQEMLAGLPPKAAAALRKSQREWIAFRDAQFGMIDEFFDTGDGGLPTMYIGFAVYARMNVTRQRVLDLAHRWDVYKMLRSELGDPVSSTVEEPPLGSWKDAKSGLTVEVEEINDDTDTFTGVNVGKRHVRIFGPPPRQGKADNILLPNKSGVTRGTLMVKGVFNWDDPGPGTDKEPAEVSVVWRDADVELEIRREHPDLIGLLPAGTYLLKPVKAALANGQ